MLRITDVVKNLLILNVIVYVVAVFLPMGEFLQPYLFLFHPKCPQFQPVQFVGSMFMHSPNSFNHILFNMLGLFFLGPMVEQRLGPKKFLLLYLVSGIIASILFLLYFQNCIPLVGASGAIFGVVAAFAMLFPDAKLMLLFPPIPIKGKYLAIVMLVMGVMIDFKGNVAHLAHLGGAIVGYAMVYYWKRKTLL